MSMEIAIGLSQSEPTCVLQNKGSCCIMGVSQGLPLNSFMDWTWPYIAEQASCLAAFLYQEREIPCARWTAEHGLREIVCLRDACFAPRTVQKVHGFYVPIQ